MKTKILFYIDTLTGGGAEKVLLTLVNSMDQTKFDITVQTTFKENGSDFLNDGITYKYCYKNRNILTDIIFRLEAESGVIYPLHVKGGYDIEVAYLECAPTKIIASSTDKNSKKTAWVHCDLRKITDDPLKFAKKSKPRYEKYDKVVCVSESVREGFTELFGDTPESVVLYNTVDSDEILKKSTSSLPDGIEKRKFTLVMLGRLSPPKNYPRLLKSVKQLLNEGFDFDLWILGDGDERRQLEDYISNNGLTENVKLFGYQSNPYPFIKQADFSVCSSNYEGFSTFITESLILGKTAVTTNCGGMKELLGENEYGIITDFDSDSFTDGLRKMLSDTELFNSYSQKAKTRGSRFSKEALTEQTQNFFLETLNN